MSIRIKVLSGQLELRKKVSLLFRILIFFITFLFLSFVLYLASPKDVWNMKQRRKRN